MIEQDSDEWTLSTLSPETYDWHPAMKEVLRRLSENNTTIVILSDANTVFIESILKSHGVRQYIDKIITNPAQFDDDGRLVISRLIPKDGKQHGCGNGCALNICKGRGAIAKDLKRDICKAKHNRNRTGTDKVSRGAWAISENYNDYCPATHLLAGDKVFVRVGKSLEAMLKHQPDRLQNIHCAVQYWKGPPEVLDAVIQESW
ncbi:unnamed protein product [Umbelopsis vinacea]